MPYQRAWDWQRTLASARSAGQRDDTLLLLEHPPTITLGRAADRAHVLVDEAELARQGVALVATDRGGDVTYHAPGQLVGYPVLKLGRYRGGLLGYLRRLEATLISVLASYGIRAGRVAGLTGVWVDPATARLDQTGSSAALDPATPAAHTAKIAAIGVRLSASGVTTHGFALNVAPDLAGFAQIIPCGIEDRGVTSLQALLGGAPPLDEVADRVVAAFADVFDIVPIFEEFRWEEQ